MLCFSYAEDEIPCPMPVTLASAQFSKLLTQLVNDARLTLCLLGVTTVRNVFKTITSSVVFVYNHVWRVICSPNTVNIPIFQNDLPVYFMGISQTLAQDTYWSVLVS
jgi:hypothetical protein